MKVAHGSINDYLADMEKDGGEIHRRIVRLGWNYRPSSMSPNIQYLSVHSSYALRDADGGETIVICTIYCGDLLRGVEDQQKPTIEEAERITSMIESKIEELELDRRGGEYRETD